jgi:hypothetical protein
LRREEDEIIIFFLVFIYVFTARQVVAFFRYKSSLAINIAFVDYRIINLSYKNLSLKAEVLQDKKPEQ